VHRVDGNVTSATNQDAHYANTSKGFHNLDGQNSDGAPGQPALIHTHTPYKEIGSAQDAGCWRDSQLIVEAIETLQRVLAGGPAADALRALTIYLDNMGPFIHTQTLASSDTSIGARGGTMVAQSDESVNLHGVHQSRHESVTTQGLYGTDQPDNGRTMNSLPTTSKRRIDIEDADFSHVSPKRQRPLQNRMSDQTSTTNDGGENGEENVAITSSHLSRNHRVVEVAAEVRCTSDFVCIIRLTMIKTIHMLWSDRYIEPGRALPHFFMSTLHSQVSDVLSCFRLLSLHPNITALAVLIIHQFAQHEDITFKHDTRMIGIALMLAERLYEGKLRPNRFWAEVTETYVAQTIIMETEFFDRINHALLGQVRDMSELLDKLDSFFDRHNEFRIPSSPLRTIRNTARKRSGYYPWNLFQPIAP
jgi:hypothetical protein